MLRPEGKIIMLKKYREEKVLLGKVYRVACTMEQTLKPFKLISMGTSASPNSTLQLHIWDLEVGSSTQITIYTYNKVERKPFSTPSPTWHRSLKKAFLTQTKIMQVVVLDIPPPSPSQHNITIPKIYNEKKSRRKETKITVWIIHEKLLVPFYISTASNHWKIITKLILIQCISEERALSVFVPSSTGSGRDILAI